MPEVPTSTREVATVPSANARMIILPGNAITKCHSRVVSKWQHFSPLRWCLRKWVACLVVGPTAVHLMRMHVAAMQTLDVSSALICMDLTNASYSTIQQFAFRLPSNIDDLRDVLDGQSSRSFGLKALRRNWLSLPSSKRPRRTSIWLLWSGGLRPRGFGS